MKRKIIALLLIGIFLFVSISTIPAIEKNLETNEEKKTHHQEQC